MPTAVTAFGIDAIISERALHQNYPSPFNPETQIKFDMAEGGFVSLRVYNLIGQEVATFLNGQMPAGEHTTTFDAANLPSGIYLYRVVADRFVAERKMLLLK